MSRSTTTGKSLWLTIRLPLEEAEKLEPGVEYSIDITPIKPNTDLFKKEGLAAEVEEDDG